MSKVKHMVVVGDIHAGSTHAVMPPEYTTLEGNVIKANLVQRWLYNCWEHFSTWVDQEVGDDQYYLLIMGDVIEGIHHGTKEVVSTELHDHAGIALELLRPLSRRSAGTFIIEGTECHTGNIEHALAKSLGAKQNPETKQYAWHSFRATINGTPIHASHHIGTTTRPYLESSQLGPTLNTERLEASRAGQVSPELVFRAHRHKFGLFEDDSGAIVVSPCWQALTRFARKVVPAAQVQCGGVLVSWDDDNDWSIKKKIYKSAKRKELEL